MNNKFCSLAFSAMILFPLVSCTNQETNKKTTTQTSPTAVETIKIAYVDVDSLMSQYQFCKDFALLFTKDSEDAKARLSRMGNALRKDAQNFQKKVQNNEFLLRSTAEKEQKKLQKRELSINQLQEKIMNELGKKQQEFNNNMRDSIQNVLKEYNKIHHFSMILSKAGDNILLSDPKMNITKEIVTQLNERYKPAKK